MKRRSTRPLTVERVKEALSYDPSTGIFVWRRQELKRAAGTVAGYTRGPGYRAFFLDGKRYYEHRLAWFYVHGRWPADQIDHINGNRSDNRIVNLREATMLQNMANTRRPKSKSGFKGVFADRARWTAQIGHQGKRIAIGNFGTPEEAYAAYCVMGKKLKGEFFIP